MKRIILAIVLFVLAVGVVFAAPGFPWLYNALDDQAVSPTPVARSFTLETIDTAHVLYHFSEGVTATVGLIVTQGFDGETLETQYVEASTDFDLDAAGIVTLTTMYPEVTLSVSTTTASGTATVGVWQR